MEILHQNKQASKADFHLKLLLFILCTDATLIFHWLSDCLCGSELEDLCRPWHGTSMMNDWPYCVKAS